MIIKKIIKKLMCIYYSKKKKLNISGRSKISYSIIKKCGYGCKFLNEVDISGNVDIGKYTSINGPSTRISAKINKIIIGNYCSIASNTVIQEYNHNYDRISTYYKNQNILQEKGDKDIVSKGDIVIEDDVWIGSNVVILSGMKIGRGSIIGAGSVVTKDVNPYTIVGGNPAKFIKKRFDDEIIDILESIKWWTWSKEKIKRNQKIFKYNSQELIKNKVEILEIGGNHDK